MVEPVYLPQIHSQRELTLLWTQEFQELQSSPAGGRVVQGESHHLWVKHWLVLDSLFTDLVRGQLPNGQFVEL